VSSGDGGRVRWRLPRQLSGAEKYRIRQGNYRILYEIDDWTKSVTIVTVGRKEVYR
jgi:mRNA interferase RelE/StbE